MIDPTILFAALMLSPPVLMVLTWMHRMRLLASLIEKEID